MSSHSWFYRSKRWRRSGAGLHRLTPSSGRRSEFSGNFYAVSFYWEKYKKRNLAIYLYLINVLYPVTDFNSFLLKILCTLSVTICECECSVSAFRRLKAHMRTSMGQERLKDWHFTYILHYTRNIDINEVVDIFARKHARRLTLVDILNSDWKHFLFIAQKDQRFL